MVDKKTEGNLVVVLSMYEVQVLLHQLTTTWAEPANQEAIINITNKLKNAVRLGEGPKLDRQSS